MSAEAMLDAARRLWPAPATVTAGRTLPAPAGVRRLEFALVPSAADPRLVVPLASRAAAAQVVRSATAPGSVKAAARTSALAAAFASGAAPALLRDRLVVDLPAGAAGLDEELARVLGRPVVVGFRVGPPRANRKPVLQVVSPEGELLAYAKLGVSPLTDSLVAAEGRALTRLGSAILGQVKVPEVLHLGEWDGHPLLVQAALPVRRSAGSDAGPRIARAMLTVARSEGTAPTAVRDLPWWAATRSAVDGLPAGPYRTELAAIGDRLDELAGTVVPSGAWHGDWNAGNCAVRPDAVLVWDWERYETGVPAGFDALHLALQSSLGSGVAPAAAAGRTVSDAPHLLAPFGVPSTEALLVSMLYLWGLGARYARDDQAAAGAAVGRLEDWLLPVLAQGLVRLAGSTQVGSAATHSATEG